MANTILHKRSSSASAAPTTGDLALGEIAINTYDGKLFIKKDNGTASIVEIGAGGGGGGGGGGGATGGIIYENGQTVSANIAITSGSSGMSTGPITVNSGVTVTVPTGSRWVIL